VAKPVTLFALRLPISSFGASLDLLRRCESGSTELVSADVEKVRWTVGSGRADHLAKRIDK
jgi:hypothetical protein